MCVCVCLYWVCVCIYINRNIWDAGTKESYNTTMVTGRITLLQLHDMHLFRRSPLHHPSCCVAHNKMINTASLRNISYIKSTLMVITRQRNRISFKITLRWPSCHFVFLGHVSHGWSCKRPSQLADTRVGFDNLTASIKGKTLHNWLTNLHVKYIHTSEITWTRVLLHA